VAERPSAASDAIDHGAVRDTLGCQTQTSGFRAAVAIGVDVREVDDSIVVAATARAGIARGVGRLVQ
jgi:hypothetical protein